MCVIIIFQLITEQLVTGNLNNALTAVEEVLDLDHLRNLMGRKMLEFYEVLQMILKILQRLCAPVRDKFVQELKEETDLVTLFRYRLLFTRQECLLIGCWF